MAFPNGLYDFSHKRWSNWRSLKKFQGKLYAGLKKTQLKPHLKKQWCIPQKQNPEFVARMEDILQVYQLDYDQDILLICMDEQPVQLLGDKITPLPMKTGRTKREDFEYVRK